LECEEELRALQNEIEKIIQEDTYEAIKEPITENHIRCHCGHKARYKDTYEKVLNTGRTEVKLKRRAYYCKNCKKLIYPLDDIYGLTGVKAFSPMMTSIMSYLASKMSYGETQDTISEILIIKVSPTAVQNQSEKLGKEVFNDKFSYIPPENQKKCDRMLLFVDGGMLHTGKELYKETRVGVLVKFYANQGFTIHKIGICEDSNSFIQDFDRFCRFHGSLSCDDIAIIGDGASWLDTLKEDCFPNAVRIVDYYHAKEYLINALKELYGEEWQNKKESIELLGLLESGECLEISQELKCKLKKNKDTNSSIFKAQRYYENHYSKMYYDDYYDSGYPIGSGEVEGCVRHLVHDRMGKSRSTWTVDDANAILILRAYIINGYWNYVKQKRYQAMCKFSFLHLNKFTL
jgi:hypothetical protein